MARYPFFIFGFLILLSITCLTVGIIGMKEIKSRYVQVTCSYHILLNLTTYAEYYQPVVEITAQDIVRIIDYYPVPLEENFAISECYLYSCDGVNCPLIKLDMENTLLDFFIFLIIVSVLSFGVLVICIVTWLKKQAVERQTYEEVM